MRNKETPTMGPEIHYQLIANRVAELRAEAAEHRRVREALAGRAGKSRGSERRSRAVFGKLRTS
ncbi:hypothetical protein Sru01_51230 [Sphaerisporangium rufum]|uniref:Uncharacterized protein n=2 Tax=Sphaerisporangium rufum TaxID=1381558 RepID=A0A919V0J5_9ACTN|nr:hypothetical protein Sru01_51230 [Sphaerisporangium rufum]